MPPEDHADKLEHRTLGDYQILRELGEGGMGVVYHARQTSLDREVALKVIRPILASNPGLMARFRRECAVHAELSHPNIVRLYDTGEADGLVFCAMELLEAKPLDTVIKEAGTTQEMTLLLRVAEALGESLAYLHPKGMVHRDIKPSNIMIENQTGRVVLMDFGLVKPQNMTALTREGRTVGSPRYMAPEMLEGGAADPRSDLYQVGLTLYQLSTGKLPFEGDDLVTLATNIVRGGAKAPREVNPALSSSLSNLVMNLIERDPEKRYPSAEAFLGDLRRLRAGRSVRRLFPEPGAAPGAHSSSGSMSAVDISAPGATTGQVPRLSSSGIQAPVPASSFPLRLLLGTLLLLSPLPFLLAPRAPWVAQDLEVVPGVGEALVRWRSDQDYPSRLEIRGAEREPWQVTGPPPGPDGTRQVRVAGLTPGGEYTVRVVFPGGKGSLSVAVPPILARGPVLEASEYRYRGGEIQVVLRTAPPTRVSLRYRASDGWKQTAPGPDFATENLVTIPAPGSDDEFRDVVASLEAVGAGTDVELPTIPGLGRRIDRFAERLQDLDLAPVLAKLTDMQGEGPESLRALARGLVEIPEIERELAVLAPPGFAWVPPTPRAWKTYAALRHLECVEMWLRGKGISPIFGLLEVYRPLVGLGWSKDAPPGGTPLLTLGFEDVTSLAIHGGTGQGRLALQMYASMAPTLRSQDGHRIAVATSGEVAPGGRSMLGLRTRNLNPDVTMRARFDEGPWLDAFNTAESFPGTYWMGIQDKLDPDKIRASTSWNLIEFPSELIGGRQHELHIRVEVPAGMSATHYVDLYEIRLWERAPGLPPAPAKKSSGMR